MGKRLYQTEADLAREREIIASVKHPDSTVEWFSEVGKETDVDCLVTRPDGHRVAIEIKDRYKYTVRFFEDEGVVLSKSKVARALLFATHRDAEPLFVVRTKEGRVFAARMADITATSPTEWFQRQRGSDHRVDHEEPVYRIDWSLFEEMPIRE